ncbi:hypothetical protein LTR78_008541 [Recurvomyces mirabilis]|uniref:Uncharacterized protein n=1 Tax=Recurvomyces mirabilis TaxID=574656 RepID=A0AAE0TUM0_9PEZI|nr:hypothetical protein LTR78_008541 [Recurvomyces mirabilis]KAK5156292.1 hypothetical protein LTS14_005180 [Recurvomyces mirabilis]
MEAQMRNEYAAAVRKAKKCSVADTPVTKKRKSEDVPAESSKKTKVSLKVGGITVNIEQNSLKLESVTKRTKASASDAPTKSATAKVSATPKASKTAQECLTKPPKKIPAKEPSPAKKKGETAMYKITLSKTTPSKSTSEAKAEPQAEMLQQSGWKREPKKEPAFKNQSTNKEEKSIKNDAAVGDATLSYQHATTPQRLTIHDEHNITGIHDLQCEQVALQLPEYVDKLVLPLCLGGKTIWGGFELANKSSVLRIDGVKLGQSVSFGWRTRDSWDSGRLKFGRGCFGDGNV